jgi:RNA polymerase sigma-70 factor (ECF subfamily)
MLTIGNSLCLSGEEQSSTVTVSNVTMHPAELEFERLFREHSHFIYRTAYSVTGSPQDAEDVLQAVFLGLLQRGLPAGLKENPRAYLYRAAVNLSLNTLRSRRRNVLTADMSAVDAHVEPTEPSVEALERRLVHGFAQLSPRAVEMLILRYEHNYGEAEIGKLLRTSRGVVAVTLYRARARLRKMLSTSGDEP